MATAARPFSRGDTISASTMESMRRTDDRNNPISYDGINRLTTGHVRTVRQERLRVGIDWTKIIFGAQIIDRAHCRIHFGLIITPIGGLDVAEVDVEVTGNPTQSNPDFTICEWPNMGDVTSPPAIAEVAVGLTGIFPDGNTYRFPICEVFFDEQDLLHIGRRIQIAPAHVGAIPVYGAIA